MFAGVRRRGLRHRILFSHGRPQRYFFSLSQKSFRTALLISKIQFASMASRIVSPVAISGFRGPSNSSSANREPEADDVRSRRTLAPNQSGNGLPRCVPHRRYSTGAGTAVERADGGRPARPSRIRLTSPTKFSIGCFGRCLTSCNAGHTRSWTTSTSFQSSSVNGSEQT